MSCKKEKKKMCTVNYMSHDCTHSVMKKKKQTKKLQFVLPLGNQCNKTNIYITKVTASAFVFTQLWTPDPNLHWTLPTGNERHNRSWETSMRWCYCDVTDSVNRINSKIMNYQYHCISRCIHRANCLQNIHLLRTVCQTVQSAQQGLGCYGHAVQTGLEPR